MFSLILILVLIIYYRVSSASFDAETESNNLDLNDPSENEGCKSVLNKISRGGSRR